MPVTVPIYRLPHGDDLPLPARATAQAAGVDVIAAVGEDLVIAPGAWAAVPTGVAIALPPGLTVLNSPGTIDADYRGEIKVLLINHGAAPVVIQRGMRIAQLVIAAHATVAWQDHGTGLEPTARGEGGFGSTGGMVEEVTDSARQGDGE